MPDLSILLALTLGLLLSLSAGLRAFFAPAALAVAGWQGWVELPAALAWLAHPVSVLTFTAAVLCEVASDKIPLVDHAMDALHVVVKPATGALVALAALQGAPPVVAAAAAIVTGGAVAGGAHVAKATVRAGSTATSAGAANPVLSLLEDGAAVALTVGGAALLGALGGQSG
jgi:uncharacterized membrane protein